MNRGPLFQDTYRPQFSGHETFPLRYGWLNKAFESVSRLTETQAGRAVFGDDAIARFGVGRNMVASIRHWANACGIISEDNGAIETTALGERLFGRNALDEFMEHPATLWLVHWHLCARANKTTWFWAFSHFPAEAFDRDHLVRGLERFVKDQGWTRASATTVKNDVACFIRTYAAESISEKQGNDDSLESPLTELGLIKSTGRRDGFRFVRGPKSTLDNGVFAFSVTDFWSRRANAATLSFESLMHEPGSPGQVYLLDETDLVDRLQNLDQVTNGKLRWSETAGLKQVMRSGDLDPTQALSLIDQDYVTVRRKRAST